MGAVQQNTKRLDTSSPDDTFLTFDTAVPNLIWNDPVNQA